MDPKGARRVGKSVDRAAATAYDVGQQVSSTFQSRGFKLEDNEYLYGHDLDIEERWE